MSSSRPKPASERCSLRAIALTIEANVSTSACFEESNRVAFEEGDHPLEECAAISHDVHERTIGLAVRLDVATAEPRHDQLEHLGPVTVLADMELRHELKTDATRTVSLHRDRKASFSVDMTREVAIQPFLLIVRTRHVVTTVYVRSDDTMSSAGYSDIPAYSQIYRQRIHCLTTF